MVERAGLPQTGTCSYSAAPGRPFLLVKVRYPREPAGAAAAREDALCAAKWPCGSERALASDLARFCRGRLPAETETRISVKPERSAGYGLGGKRGRGRTLVRRVRGEPFDEALCAVSADFGDSLPLQT